MPGYMPGIFFGCVWVNNLPSDTSAGPDHGTQQVLLCPRATCVHPARSLLQFHPLRFVGFDDGAQPTGALACRARDEAVAPAKTRCQVHTGSGSRLPHRVRVEHALQIGQPAFFLAQPRQRRARQGVKAAPAVHTAKALQTTGVAAPMRARTMAVWTRSSACGLLDEGDALGRILDGGQPFA